MIGTPWLNCFDIQIELFLNHFMGRYPWFDLLVFKCAVDPVLLRLVIVLIVWYLLFDRRGTRQLRKDSELLIASAFLAMMATLVTRVLADGLPFRARPISITALHFHIPYPGTLGLINWNSFPSDHATLFFALAAGIFMVSRRLGWFAFAWVFLFICFPRLYIGLHWPTDILAGAFIGISIVQMARIPAVRNFVKRTATEWNRFHPYIFLTVVFIWCIEIATVLENIRGFFVWLLRLL
jgi:undecaprenyl-diphosphatase